MREPSIEEKARAFDDICNICERDHRVDIDKVPPYHSRKEMFGWNITEYLSSNDYMTSEGILGK